MRTELYKIEGPWRGRLAIVPRPRGGDWLEDEIAAWKHAGLDVIVSALTEEECAELDLARERELCGEQQIVFVSFPIMDRCVPTSAKATLELARRLEERLDLGKNVAIHCRQGVGRAALLAACLLTVGGIDPSLALDRVAAGRGCAIPDTSEQREWVLRFARDMLTTFHEGTIEGERRISWPR